MRRSFYHYLMTHRTPKELFAENTLANLVDKDSTFPKQSSDYEEVSSYLEMEGYLPSMALFDEVWEKYIENNK